VTRAGAAPSAAKRVEGFIAKFDPSVARLARSARRALRRRLPTAVELVYDNYNALAIGWGPNERTSEAFVSLAVFPRGVLFYFLRGASLRDPKGLLQGQGKRGRYLRLEQASLIADPDVESLLRAAIALGRTPLPKTGRGYTVVKSVSARQRPRR
jgi:hypothetical protein